MKDFEDSKFVYIFWYCAGVTVIGLVLLTLLIFGTIPKDNQQMADVALGFITGTLISGVLQYLIGGTPAAKKSDTAVTQTGDSPVTNVTPTPPPPTQP